MDLILKRTKFNDAVIGTLSVLGQDNPVWHTLELPDKDNQRNISCIEAGTYLVKPYSSKKYKDVWEVQNVKGRSNILIHIGNFTNDTEGCILIGTDAGYMYNNDTGSIEKSVKSSGAAIEELREVTKYPNEFNLLITS